MRGRFPVWVAVATCLVMFVAFLAHKPACSESRILHNKPVPAFRALIADVDLKGAMGAVAQVAVLQAVVALALQIQPTVTETSPPLEGSSSRALLTCLLC